MKRKRMGNCLVTLMVLMGVGCSSIRMLTPYVSHPLSGKEYEYKEFVGKRYQVITPLVIAKYKGSLGHHLDVPKNGIVTKQDFEYLTKSNLDPEELWQNLIENGYIDEKGVIQDKFIELGSSSYKMRLKDEYKKESLIIAETLLAHLHEGIKYIAEVPVGSILVIHHISVSDDFEGGTMFHFISEFETQGIFRGRFDVGPYSFFIHKKGNKGIALKEIISADPQYLREIND